MQKSKKDLAFDREREKFRHEIHYLKGEVQSKDLQIRGFIQQIEELENKIRELEDWNERLLEYMDMPEEDMRRVLQGKDIESQVSESIRNITKIFLGGKL